MKIRDSGMPDQGMWEGFFSPAQILNTLEFDSGVRDAVKFGCGYCTFTIPAAKIISGKIFVFDIEPEMVEATKKAAVDQHVMNIEAASALGTVGLSMGITTALTVLGKLIIILMMYIGRVGPLTFGMAFYVKPELIFDDEKTDLAV